MDKITDKLIDAVIEQMKKQIEQEDWTAIDELLRFVPRENLVWFLPEEDWAKHGDKPIFCPHCALERKVAIPKKCPH